MLKKLSLALVLFAGIFLFFCQKGTNEKNNTVEIGEKEAYVKLKISETALCDMDGDFQKEIVSISKKEDGIYISVGESKLAFPIKSLAEAEYFFILDFDLTDGQKEIGLPIKVSEQDEIGTAFYEYYDKQVINCGYVQRTVDDDCLIKGDGKIVCKGTIYIKNG